MDETEAPAPPEDAVEELEERATELPEPTPPTPAEHSQELPSPEPVAPLKKRQKQPKEQCPTCLRYYSLARVAPGMHRCVPPVPKAGEEGTSVDDQLRPESPTPEPPPTPDVMERQINYDDVLRFLTRERLSRHERKRERWVHQMFG